MKGVNKLATFLLVGILSVSSVYSADVQDTLSTLGASKANKNGMLLLDEVLFSNTSESAKPGMLSEAMKRVGTSLKTVAPQFCSTLVRHHKMLSLITLLSLPVVSRAVIVYNDLPYEIEGIAFHEVGGGFDKVSVEPGEKADLPGVSTLLMRSFSGWEVDLILLKKLAESVSTFCWDGDDFVSFNGLTDSSEIVATLI